MAVVPYFPPNHTTKASTSAGANAYMAEIEAAIKVLALGKLNSFSAHAQAVPDMTVRVESGTLSTAFGMIANAVPASGQTDCNNSAGATVTVIAAQSTPAFTAPTLKPRVDRIGVNILFGTLSVLVGAEATAPVPMPYPDFTIPVCSVTLVPGQAAITNAHITDERSPLVDLISSGNAGAVSTSPYRDISGYEIFNVPGTYNLVRPAQSRGSRITLLGGRGGRGGGFYDVSSVFKAGGAGGGAGAFLPKIIWGPENLNVVVGTNGINGADNSPGGNDATAGSAGTATTVTGVTSGITATCNAGTGGSRATSATTPGTAVGLGGTAPAAPFAVGFAGANGAVGTVAPAYGANGSAGELGQLGTTNSFALIEWLF